MEHGPQLRFPHSSGVAGSTHTHMRELRVQSGGRPLCIFYAFDPRRTAILLVGGDKTGDERFVAHFPEGSVTITNFCEVEAEETEIYLNLSPEDVICEFREKW